ncbi:DUF4351 domain-containing protein [Desulfobacterales bacterium HSG17]|nr:DUF4351 domain-containing protein [Desulfobacterales bacterium HSG17]
MGFKQFFHEEGKREGEISLFKRLLTRRFGSFPAWTSERLKKADIKDIEIWTDRILDAKSVEDIFTDQGLSV